MATEPARRPELPDVAEIVIVGAGVTGLCAGLYLAQSGHDVVVLDRGEPWGDASGANAGTLSVQIKRPEVVDLTLESTRLWQEFAEQFAIDVGFVRCGGLRVATSPGEVVRLRQSVADQQAQGLEVEVLEGDAMRAAAPWLGHDVLAASHCPWDSLSVPLSAGHGLILAVGRAGGRVIGNAGVDAIDNRGDGFRVVTGAGVVRCRILVIAAGAWLGDIAAMLGVDLPVMVDVNMLTITEPSPSIMDRIVTHIGGMLSVKQYANGTCIIGGGWQGRGGRESGRKELDYVRLLHNLRFAARVVPALADLRVVRSWSGFEAVTPDALPLFGALPGNERAFVVGCSRGGYSQGPALGHLLCQLIASGHTSLPMQRFSPARFLQ